MKKNILTIGLIIFAQYCYSQAKYDETSGLILERMSKFIVELQSVSFTLHSSNDILNEDNNIIKKFENDEVIIVEPDKMLVNSFAKNSHQTCCYNETKLVYYSQNENNYGIIDAPTSIIQTMNEVSKIYGIKFTAANFFNPTFTDDIIASCLQIPLEGKAMINGKECMHIIAIGKEINLQFWISNYNLPVKFVINYKQQPRNPQYEADFSDWQIKPIIPNTVFDFTPFADANEVKLISISGNN